MKITVDEARAYFAHPSQQVNGVRPDNLPPDFEYWAKGGVCLSLHPMPWPNVWMAHVAAKPEAWGATTEPSRAILRAFWAHHSPARVVAWVPASNRAVMAFSERLGFVTDGAFVAGGAEIIMRGWKP